MNDWRQAKADPQATKRLIIAVAISAALMLGFNLVASKFFPQPVVTKEQTAKATPAATPSTTQAPLLAEATSATTIMLQNSQVIVAVNTIGGRLTHWQLKPFGTTVNDADGYTLFSTTSATPAYWQFGWQGAGVEGPGESTAWQVIAQTANTLTLGWENASGQKFTRTYTLPADGYNIDISEQVANTASLPIGFRPYAQYYQVGENIAGDQKNLARGSGPGGAIENAEKGEPRFFTASTKDLRKDGQSNKVSGTGGWWGYSTHFFLSALLPDATTTDRWFTHSTTNGQEWFGANIQWPALIAQPGQAQQLSYQLYGGPKEISALQNAGHQLSLAINWGWFAFMAKPMHSILVWLHAHLGNWGLAVIGLTVLLKLVTFPLANKSYAAMAKMRKLQPQVEALKTKHGKDQQAMSTHMMALYRQEKVNPMSGCWPMLIQIPIFLAMYKVVSVSFEFRHAPLGLWIHDMSAADPYFVLPVLMGASMWFQMHLQPQPADPSQAMVFKWMPIIFTVMFLWFPAALVLYWLTNNLLSIAQQYVITKHINKAK